MKERGRGSEQHGGEISPSFKLVRQGNFIRNTEASWGKRNGKSAGRGSPGKKFQEEKTRSSRTRADLLPGQTRRGGGTERRLYDG